MREPDSLFDNEDVMRQRVLFEALHKILSEHVRGKALDHQTENAVEVFLEATAHWDLNYLEECTRSFTLEALKRLTTRPKIPELLDMFLKKFDPAPPPANSFQAREEEPDLCPLCHGWGVDHQNGRDVYCTCAAGEEARQKQTFAKFTDKPPARPVLHPPSSSESIGGFDVDLRLLHPSEVRQKRADKPTKKDWADRTPTHERLQSLLNKDPQYWSAKDRAFLRRLDKS